MSLGTALALAAWFAAFVWAVTISDNAAAAAVVAGVVIAVMREGL